MIQDVVRRVTVCIPTFNQSQYILQSISSALTQTTPVEVFVSNDGSSDNTALILAEANFGNRVKIVNHVTNVGIGRHVNWLLQQPGTEMVARLDSDDRLNPSYVEELLALLDAYPRAGYAHCAVQEMDAEGCPRMIRKLARKSGYEDAESALRKMVLGYKVAANIILFRREALSAAGFGTTAINFAEDYDLCIRIADAGWGNVYADQVLACYRVWSAPTRQSVTRKISEIKGLHHVYSVSLGAAFLKRGWSTRTLRWRRLDLALGHSDCLDHDMGVTDQERDVLQTELMKLAGFRWASALFAKRGLGKWARLGWVRIHHLRSSAKRAVKELVGRREPNLRNEC
jgi:glycosyltransferase involved in cell wall biosynthesis